ncbi:helix-turn-helix protein [Motilibacter rhizosphaerae]|uniref:Helix-turn-helix protein n=1 Tax=Motilibacter rhizosphaerae TaxID=598652 RepID=A0A4Q7NAY5_9ACTN|nr:helix-turn-helix transcriptional regulator [Motilibacter rhizosphaerae]RZS79970.1 helix-turn-helix protein [Motilibacter rhizosphaerae]
MPTDRSALGAFLRSRRDGLTPAQAGIAPFPGARRVPGLRKEELAVLAGMSAEHYSRLEQGRQHAVSDDVVEALARALQLDDLERAHLRALAAPRRARATAAEPPQQPQRGLLRLMTALDHLPVLLLGRRSDVLSTNALLAAVLGPEVRPGRSFVRWLFLHEDARSRLTNWAEFAAAAMGSLRYEAGLHPDDSRLAALVEELCRRDADAAAWWADQRVTFRTSLQKRIAHPVAGPLEFGIEVVAGPHDPDQRLVVYTVEPDSSTAKTLPLLASWAPEPTVGDGSLGSQA